MEESGESGANASEKEITALVVEKSVDTKQSVSKPESNQIASISYFTSSLKEDGTVLTKNTIEIPIIPNISSNVSTITTPITTTTTSEVTKPGKFIYSADGKLRLQKSIAVVNPNKFIKLQKQLKGSVCDAVGNLDRENKVEKLPPEEKIRILASGSSTQIKPEKDSKDKLKPNPTSITPPEINLNLLKAQLQASRRSQEIKSLLQKKIMDKIKTEKEREQHLENQIDNKNDNESTSAEATSSQDIVTEKVSSSVKRKPRKTKKSESDTDSQKSTKNKRSYVKRQNSKLSAEKARKTSQSENQNDNEIPANTSNSSNFADNTSNYDLPPQNESISNTKQSTLRRSRRSRTKSNPQNTISNSLHELGDEFNGFDDANIHKCLIELSEFDSIKPKKTKTIPSFSELKSYLFSKWKPFEQYNQNQDLKQDQFKEIAGDKKLQVNVNVVFEVDRKAGSKQQKERNKCDHSQHKLEQNFKEEIINLDEEENCEQNTKEAVYYLDVNKKDIQHFQQSDQLNSMNEDCEIETTNITNESLSEKCDIKDEFFIKRENQDQKTEVQNVGLDFDIGKYIREDLRKRSILQNFSTKIETANTSNINNSEPLTVSVVLKPKQTLINPTRSITTISSSSVTTTYPSVTTNVLNMTNTVASKTTNSSIFIPNLPNTLINLSNKTVDPPVLTTNPTTVATNSSFKATNNNSDGKPEHRTVIIKVIKRDPITNTIKGIIQPVSSSASSATSSGGHQSQLQKNTASQITKKPSIFTITSFNNENMLSSSREETLKTAKAITKTMKPINLTKLEPTELDKSNVVIIKDVKQDYSLPTVQQQEESLYLQQQSLKNVQLPNNVNSSAPENTVFQEKCQEQFTQKIDMKQENYDKDDDAVEFLLNYTENVDSNYEYCDEFFEDDDCISIDDSNSDKCDSEQQQEFVDEQVSTLETDVLKIALQNDIIIVPDTEDVTLPKEITKSPRNENHVVGMIENQASFAKEKSFSIQSNAGNLVGDEHARVIKQEPIEIDHYEVHDKPRLLPIEIQNKNLIDNRNKAFDIEKPVQIVSNKSSVSIKTMQPIRNESPVSINSVQPVSNESSVSINSMQPISNENSVKENLIKVVDVVTPATNQPKVRRRPQKVLPTIIKAKLNAKKSETKDDSSKKTNAENTNKPIEIAPENNTRSIGKRPRSLIDDNINTTEAQMSKKLKFDYKQSHKEIPQSLDPVKVMQQNEVSCFTQNTDISNDDDLNMNNNKSEEVSEFMEKSVHQKNQENEIEITKQSEQQEKETLQKEVKPQEKEDQQKKSEQEIEKSQEIEKQQNESVQNLNISDIGNLDEYNTKKLKEIENAEKENERKNLEQHETVRSNYNFEEEDFNKKEEQYMEKLKYNEDDNRKMKLTEKLQEPVTKESQDNKFIKNTSNEKTDENSKVNKDISIKNENQSEKCRKEEVTYEQKKISDIKIEKNDSTLQIDNTERSGQQVHKNSNCNSFNNEEKVDDEEIEDYLFHRDPSELIRILNLQYNKQETSTLEKTDENPQKIQEKQLCNAHIEQKCTKSENQKQNEVLKNDEQKEITYSRSGRKIKLTEKFKERKISGECNNKKIAQLDSGEIQPEMDNDQNEQKTKTRIRSISRENLQLSSSTTEVDLSEMFVIRESTEFIDQTKEKIDKSIEFSNLSKNEPKIKQEYVCSQSSNKDLQPIINISTYKTLEFGTSVRDKSISSKNSEVSNEIKLHKPLFLSRNQNDEDNKMIRIIDRVSNRIKIEKDLSECNQNFNIHNESETLINPSTEMTQITVEVASKKRSRKPKIKVSENESLSETAQTKEDLNSSTKVDQTNVKVAPKKRGKKSKIKISENDSLNETPQTKEDLNSSTKVDQTNVEVTSKKRGRKPKIKVSENDSLNETPQTKEDLDSSTKVDQTNVEVTPKKRGRKSKIKISENDSLNETAQTKESDQSPCVKKRRKKEYVVADRLLHPKLLLVTNRAQLIEYDEQMRTNTEEKPIILAENEVLCGLCKEITTRNSWSKHLTNHYGVGWIDGKEEPVDVTSFRDVKEACVRYFKKYNVKSLNCRLCNLSMKSGLGLIGHLEICGLSAEEKEKFMIKCDYCGNKYSHTTFQQHVKQNCRAIHKKEESIVSESNEGDAMYSKSGRCKRKSVIKAEKMFMEEFQDINEDITNDAAIKEKFVKSFKPPLGATLIWKFKTQIASYGYGKCVGRECNFSSEDIQLLIEHDKDCEFVPRKGFACVLCNYFSPEENGVVQHWKIIHKSECVEDKKEKNIKKTKSNKIDDEYVDKSNEINEESSDSNDSSLIVESIDLDDENLNEGKQKKKTQKKFETTFNKNINFGNLWLKEDPVKLEKRFPTKMSYFENIHFTEDILFDFALPIIEPKMEDFLNSYLPINQHSMRFSFISSSSEFKKILHKTDIKANTITWNQIERFSIKNYTNKEKVIFMGGSISCLTWIPVPKTSHSQYLVVSCKNHIKQSTLCINPEPVKTIILIYEILQQNNEAKLLYGIPYNTGPVHQIEFLPSGGYCTNLNRLGLMGISSIKSEINLYSLPLKAPKNCDNNYYINNEKIQFINLKPVIMLKLKLRNNDNENQCSKICWSKAKNHHVIAGAYPYGYLAFWNIDNNANNLNKFLINNVRTFIPVVYFRPITESITGLEFHYDMNGLRWIIVSSVFRDIVIYDIKNLSNPEPIFQLNDASPISSIKWPLFWENFLHLSLDHLGSNSAVKVTSVHRIKFLTFRTLVLPSDLNDIDFNNLKSNYAAVSRNGLLVISPFINLSQEKGKKPLTEHPVNASYSGLIQLQNKSEFDYNLEDYNEKYGLIIGPMNTVKIQELEKTKQTLPLHLTTYLKINKVACNNNKNGNNLYAIGYENGLVRIVNFEGG